MVPSSAPRNDITRCFTHSRNTGSRSAVMLEGFTWASSFQVALMLSHTSRVSAVRTARPLLRAVLMRGADGGGIVLVEDQELDDLGAGDLRVLLGIGHGRRRRTAASSATRRGGPRRRRASARCGSPPRAGAPCSPRAPCSATSSRARRRCVRASVLQHPGILGAAALAGIDHQRTLLERHAREPARRDRAPCRPTARRAGGRHGAAPRRNW